MWAAISIAAILIMRLPYFDCKHYLNPLQHNVRMPGVFLHYFEYNKNWFVSLGGHFAIMVTAWHPHLVRGLIIGDAPFDRTKLRSMLLRDQQRLLYWRDFAGPTHSLEEITEALKNTPIAIEGQATPVPARTLFGEKNPWFRDMAENLRLNDPEMLTAIVEFDRMHEGYDYEQLFPMISCPVLIIQGSPALGGLLTNEEIEHTLTFIPQARVARMETVGHPLHTQEKEPILLAITSFVDTLQKQRV